MQVKRAKELEVAAVRAAEGGDLGNALELLNQAAEEAPDFASVYNNRAQASCVALWGRVGVVHCNFNV